MRPREARKSLGLAFLIAAFAVMGCADSDPEDERGFLDDLFGKRGVHVPAAEQERLPSSAYTLSTAVCPPGFYPADDAKKLRRTGRRQLRALTEALERHPENIVTVTSALSDPEPDQPRTVAEEMTVLELAKGHLGPLEDPGISPAGNRAVVGDRAADCEERLHKRLSQLVEKAEVAG